MSDISELIALENAIIFDLRDKGYLIKFRGEYRGEMWIEVYVPHMGSQGYVTGFKLFDGLAICLFDEKQLEFCDPAFPENLYETIELARFTQMRRTYE
jgi:hypothetical protein